MKCGKLQVDPEKCQDSQQGPAVIAVGGRGGMKIDQRKGREIGEIG